MMCVDSCRIPIAYVSFLDPVQARFVSGMHLSFEYSRIINT